MRLRRLFAVVALMLLLSAGPAAAGWMHRIVSGRAIFMTLAVGPDGVTHYLYYSLKSSSVIHQKFDARGKKIFSETVPMDSAYSSPSALAVDRNNHLHLILMSASGLKYGFFDGSTWTFQDVPTSNCQGFPGLAVDADAHPHLSCVSLGPCPTGSYNTSLIHLSYDGSTWSSEVAVECGWDPTVHGYISAEGASLPFRIGADGSLHIGFRLGNQGANKMCEAAKSSDQWSRNCSPFSYTGYYFFMDLDPSCRPHFAYVDSMGLHHSYFDGANWSDEIAESSVDFGGSIAVGPDGNPGLLYTQRLGRNDAAVYSVRKGGVWLPHVVGRGPGMNMGYSDALSLDPVGLPHGGLSVYAGPNFAVYGQLTLPDLTATWEPITTATNKGKFTVTGRLHVSNRGTASGGGFSVLYFLSDDDQLDDNDVAVGKSAIGSVGVGKQRVITFNYRPTASVSGKYLIAQISSKAPDKEAPGTNNTAAGQIP
jgi:hypothetical protein